MTQEKYQTNGGTLVIHNMYTSELQRLLKSNVHISKCFKGIYSSDNVPAQIGIQKFVVINTAPKHHEGIHWVVLFRVSRDVYEYFDSLGAKVDFMKKILNIDGTVEYSTAKLQSDSSESCGLFVGQ